MKFKRAVSIAGSALLLAFSAGCGGDRGRAASTSDSVADPAADPAGARAGEISPARRIVSLIPAATEILFALGAGDRVVGRTHWDRFPPEAARVADVGDGMRPSLETVLARRPDLVVLYRGVANEGVDARFEAAGIRTLVLEHDTFSDLERNIALLGTASGCARTAQRLVARIRSGLDAVAEATADARRVSVYYDVWHDPPITIGRGSYLDSLMTLAGARNVFGDLEAASPQVGLETIVFRDPARIISPRPDAPVSTRQPPAERPGWDAVPAVAAGRVVEVDGDLLHRLGPRVADAAAELARAIHPGLALAGPPVWEPVCAA